MMVNLIYRKQPNTVKADSESAVCLPKYNNLIHAFVSAALFFLPIQLLKKAGIH